jgi:hypothetical protein
MTKLSRILCVAQHFGFGPMAELIALGGALRAEGRGSRLGLALLNNPHLRPLVNGVRGNFDLLPTANVSSPLDALLAHHHHADEAADAVLSCYDSAAVFYGWFVGRPVFFYDGLFWFWKFDPYRHLVPELLSELDVVRKRRDERGLVDVYRRTLAIDYHLTVLLGHQLATWSYARCGHGVKARLAAYPELASKTRIVGAVIDSTVSCVPTDTRDHILVSLSGSLAPLLHFNQNLAFARGALTFALEAREVLDIGLPWFFCCHPQLHDQLAAEGRLARLPSDFTAAPSFDYRSNLDMISRAHALFISPGFSSIQEAAYFQTPVFFLPEQNGGQPAQFTMLRDAGYDTSFNWTVTDVLYGGQPVIGEEDVRALYQGIDAIWSNGLRDARLAVLRRFCVALQDQPQRSRLVKSQRDSASAVFGSFDGAAHIAKHMLDVLISAIPT